MIPANLYIEINSADLPAGPMGKNPYELWLDAGNTGTLQDFLEWYRNGQSISGNAKIKHASIQPGANTASITYVSTGLSCQIDVEQNEKILIDVRGMVNHTAQNIVHFTLKRNGVDITPMNNTGLSCARIDIADGVRALNFMHRDAPPIGQGAI